jgi:ATP-dependent DNA ligase
MRKLKARSAVLDLEVAIVEPNGRTDFHALQQALSEFGDTGAIVGYAFDLGNELGVITKAPQEKRIAYRFQTAQARDRSRQGIAMGAGLKPTSRNV